MGPQKQEAAAQSRPQRLDEELGKVKAALHKVEHELEQALNQIWNLDAGLRKLEESIGDARGVADALSGIQEGIRQLRSQADRLQDRQNDLFARTEELGRQQQVELERERPERAAALSQAEAAARSVGQFESRVRLLEESLRRVEEAVAAGRSAQETLTRDMEELSSRGARNLEAALRLEHQLDALAAEIEALHKRDGELEESVSLYEERMRREEERVEKVQGHLSLPLEIKEQLDRSRFERQQISEHLAKLEGSVNGLLERTAEFVQGLARIDQRTQAQATRQLEMAEELRRHRETVDDQLQRLVRVMERQRRRQAEALAQEIKELRRSDFNSEK
jgi:predicted  nucleic acid-binding Zn-ribbon protein